MRFNDLLKKVGIEIILNEKKVPEVLENPKISEVENVLATTPPKFYSEEFDNDLVNEIYQNLSKVSLSGSSNMSKFLKLDRVMEDVINDIDIRNSAIFAALNSSEGITKEQVLESLQEGLQLVTKENENFFVQVNKVSNENLDKFSLEIKKINSEISELEKRKLKIQTEVKAFTEKIDLNQKSFSKAFQKIVSEIDLKINQINQIK